jgi:hypothetical protein
MEERDERGEARRKRGKRGKGGGERRDPEGLTLLRLAEHR